MFSIVDKSVIDFDAKRHQWLQNTSKVFSYQSNPSSSPLLSPNMAAIFMARFAAISLL